VDGRYTRLGGFDRPRWRSAGFRRRADLGLQRLFNGRSIARSAHLVMCNDEYDYQQPVVVQIRMCELQAVELDEFALLR
jgi:hypothetical protein